MWGPPKWTAILDQFRSATNTLARLIHFRPPLADHQHKRTRNNPRNKSQRFRHREPTPHARGRRKGAKTGVGRAGGSAKRVHAAGVDTEMRPCCSLAASDTRAGGACPLRRRKSFPGGGVLETYRAASRQTLLSTAG
jgi:hypothetical protein